MVEKTWSSREPLRPVIIQNEVEQSENSFNNIETVQEQPEHYKSGLIQYFLYPVVCHWALKGLVHLKTLIKLRKTIKCVKQ